LPGSFRKTNWGIQQLLVEKILLRRVFPDEVIYRGKFYRQKSTALLLNRKEESLRRELLRILEGLD
jgi:hypothetical protein